MKFTLKRDGARLEVTNDGVAQFRGVLAKEILNPDRVVSRMPPAADLKLTPGSLYAVYTGLEVNRLSFSSIAVSGLDVRATFDVFKKTGMRVERVEIDGNLPNGELVIYVSVLTEFSLNKNVEMFESFQFGQSKPMISVAEEMTSSAGFVPHATREITEQQKQRNGPSSDPAKRELSDDQRRAQLDAWLSTGDAPTKETITPGAPARTITDGFTDANGRGLSPATAKPATPE